MKKVLAIVLALVMAFSFVSAVSAVDAVEGKVYIGAKEDVYANPGESAVVDLQLNANVFASEEYDQDGMLVIYFGVYSQDASLAPITSFELTSDAIEAGAYLETDPDLGGFFEKTEGTVDGVIKLPAAYLYGTDLTLAQVTFAVSNDWEIVDYEAAPIGITFEASFVYVESEDGSIAEISTENGLVKGDANILYQYQPTAKERLIETLKRRFDGILDLILTGLNYVKTLLAPALWNHGQIK